MNDNQVEAFNDARTARPIVPTDSESFAAPRGVAPDILLEHVRNTAPFLFQPEAAGKYPPHVQVLQRAAEIPDLRHESFDHAGYYRLCLAAHHATVATYVPTNVDNQIRFLLWHPTLDEETVRRMAELTVESRDWDCRPLSSRWIPSLTGDRVLSGHAGEWFSTIVGAYRATRRFDRDRAEEILELIASEVTHEADTFAAYESARDGVNLLKASTLIAHNLGDLDRAMEMWGLNESDPLYRRFFRLGHPDGPGDAPVLRRAGELNKALMAAENHRHFPLRAVRPLRRSADLVLPLGPFLDDWGARVASHPALSPEEVAETAEALIKGYERLACEGYARALAGIEEVFPGGMTGLASYLPARTEKALKTGALRQSIRVPRGRFESRMAASALKIVGR